MPTFRKIVLGYAVIQLLLTLTIKRVRETLFSSNGESTVSSANGAGSSKAEPKPAASDISHLIKRKRKNSGDESPAPKRVNS